ncbi:MAG: hypothetical protein ACTHMS_13205 [Jatrophihabitans sp.]|uniref:hypothetical protein n=1 Tax=Jatrophihabitans sp. TaxID=1932789 RepID=UPI003F7F85A2
MPGWLVHLLGLDSANGRTYLFWSGFGGDLPMFAGVTVAWRRFNCHQQGCWRVGLHHGAGPHLCARHKQPPKGEPS